MQRTGRNSALRVTEERSERYLAVPLRNQAEDSFILWTRTSAHAAPGRSTGHRAAEQSRGRIANRNEKGQVSYVYVNLLDKYTEPPCGLSRRYSRLLTTCSCTL